VMLARCGHLVLPRPPTPPRGAGGPGTRPVRTDSQRCSTGYVAGEDARPGRLRDGPATTCTEHRTADGSVREFLDVLTNWYVRRSRERFWGRGRGRRSTRCTRCSRRLTGSRRRCCRSVAEEHLARAHRRPQRALTDWPDAEALRPTRRSSPRWTGPGGRLGDAGPAQGAVLRVRQPLRLLTVVTATTPRLGDFAASWPTR
jgi:hypothetical protein